MQICQISDWTLFLWNSPHHLTRNPFSETLWCVVLWKPRHLCVCVMTIGRFKLYKSSVVWFCLYSVTVTTLKSTLVISNVLSALHTLTHLCPHQADEMCVFISIFTWGNWQAEKLSSGSTAQACLSPGTVAPESALLVKCTGLPSTSEAAVDHFCSFSLSLPFWKSRQYLLNSDFLAQFPCPSNLHRCSKHTLTWYYSWSRCFWI